MSKNLQKVISKYPVFLDILNPVKSITSIKNTGKSISSNYKDILKEKDKIKENKITLSSQGFRKKGLVPSSKEENDLFRYKRMTYKKQQQTKKSLKNKKTQELNKKFLSKKKRTI